VPHQAAAANQSADAMDVALTIPAGPAALMASTDTTAAIAKAKGKVKKEWSPAMAGASAAHVLHVHAPSRLRGVRSSSPELALLQDMIVLPAIDLNHTHAPVRASDVGTGHTRDHARPRPFQRFAHADPGRDGMVQFTCPTFVCNL
jgi:hypothetical protein